MSSNNDVQLPSIPDYEIESVLYKGKRSVLYKGYDATRMPVALKVLNAEWSKHSPIRDQFIQAGRTASRLTHDHIAAVLDVGTTKDECPFITMELIEGISLEEMIQRHSPLIYSKVCDILTDACKGLGYAHAQGVIHRDIKPSNIMLTTESILKIVDFGIAKAFKGEDASPETGPFLGTPRYMAPEQFKGFGIDLRSDMYALGATFYHLLTGQPPFECDTPEELMRAHTEGKIVPAYQINPTVPEELWGIIERMMQTEPSERYQDYDEIVDDLRAVKLSCCATEQIPDDEDRPETPSEEPQSEEQEKKEPEEPQKRNNFVFVPEKKPISPLRRIITWSAFFVLLLLIASVAYHNLISRAGDEKGSREGLRALIKLIIPEKKETAVSEKYVTTKKRMIIIYLAIREYQTRKGSYPKSATDVAQAGFISEEERRDAWGNSIYYLKDSDSILSFGEDGEQDTSDDFLLNSDGLFKRQPLGAREIEIGTQKGFYRR